jgi:hypothetical protein
MMSEIDLERALKDPAGLFGNPDAVVHQPTLAREQSVHVLNNGKWTRLGGRTGPGAAAVGR